jgi:hypothetical protein
MDITLPMLVLRIMVRLRARSLVDAIALASVPHASLLIGATVVLTGV